MAEIRRDLFTDKMVIIAEERSKRPLEFKDSTEKNETTETKTHCSFCLGNEEITPAEIERIEKDGVWSIRVVPNKFPILNGNDAGQYNDGIYDCIKGQGFHEVVIETNRHNGNFFNMKNEEFFNYLIILKSRYNKLKGKDNVQYISIFKNYLKEAGASLEHPHSQILTFPIISTDIVKEITNCKTYYDENNVCLHEFIMDYERKKDERLIHETHNFIIIAPYASLFPKEVEIIYKNDNRFEYITTEEIRELSSLLKGLFEKMYKLFGDFPFNMCLHTHPLNLEKTDFYRWHIHIMPRLSKMGGFELSTGVYVNEASPEKVADFLKW